MYIVERRALPGLVFATHADERMDTLLAHYPASEFDIWQTDQTEVKGFTPLPEGAEPLRIGAEAVLKTPEQIALDELRERIEAMDAMQNTEPTPPATSEALEPRTDMGV